MINSKNSLLALTVILATGLAACSKHNPKSIKAQAEVAKATNDTAGMNKAFDKAEESINESIAKLNQLESKSGMLGKYTPSFMASVSVEDRAEARKAYNRIKENAETQIGLAKALKSDEKKTQAEKSKAKAEAGLADLDSQEAKDKKSDSKSDLSVQDPMGFGQ